MISNFIAYVTSLFNIYSLMESSAQSFANHVDELVCLYIYYAKRELEYIM